MCLSACVDLYNFITHVALSIHHQIKILNDTITTGLPCATLL